MKSASKKHAVQFVGIVVIAIVAGIILTPKHHWKLPTGNIAGAASIGDGFGLIVATDGSLWNWGESRLGWQVLGFGSNVSNQISLRRIGSETNWVSASAAGSTIVDLKSDGSIRGWGDNVCGQLGNGSMAPLQAPFVVPVAGNDWMQVACGGYWIEALKRDGTLWAWGANFNGQFGDGTKTSSRAAVRIGSLTNWTRVWTDSDGDIGLQADGSLWCWGWDHRPWPFGASVTTPTRVSGDTNWVHAALSRRTAFGIKSDGSLWSWGMLAHMYTGAGMASNSAPARIGTESDWISCAASAGSFPLLMKRDGSLWILDASSSGRVAEVTSIASGLVKNNVLRCMADSKTFGGDPDFGNQKSLGITYQLGKTRRTEIFSEDSPIKLGLSGQTLTISRAYYGNSNILSEFSAKAPGAITNRAAVFRRIEVPGQIVAFACGPRNFGVALTSEGEVWNWGELLGRKKRPVPALQTLSRALNRIGGNVQWGEAGPVVADKPERLEIDYEH